MSSKVAGPKSPKGKRTIALERTFEATLEEVWALWTTREGLESWWGPVGFTTRVLKLELRPGGAWHYAMTATGADQVRFMKSAGMPLTSEARATYSEVVPMTRLAYATLADFIPDVEPYQVAAVVELEARGKKVKMVVTLDAMHDETWTERSVMGWEQQLGKLEKLLAG